MHMARFWNRNFRSRKRCICYLILGVFCVWLIIAVSQNYSKNDDHHTKLDSRNSKIEPRHKGQLQRHQDTEDYRDNLANYLGRSEDKIRLMPRVVNQNFRFFKNVQSSNDADSDDTEAVARQSATKQTAKKAASLNGGLLPEELGIVRDPQDQQLRDQGYRQHAFNQLISDRIGFHRNITDTRNELCKYQVYPKNLPRSSVIICFFNEAWSTLLRTVYSVIERTPMELLHEIILVDDFSYLDHLKDKLDQFISNNLHPLVRIIHNTKREGLIRARVAGSRAASGEVLVFLDSHCEVNTYWLEPLLDRIQEDRQTVVCPIIDIINSDSFTYQSSPLVRGGFNWGLHFKWDTMPPDFFKDKTEIIKPLRSATMAGGLFAVNRKYFKEIGEYDEGMDIWGGENLEISFRIWQCGGKLEIIPCSRVGHVFRKRRPYGAPGGADTMSRNSLRVAHVWMDEYKEHFFRVKPNLRNRTDYGDISSRQKLRQDLECKSFKWYMNTIYPDAKPPSRDGPGVNFAKGQRFRERLQKNVMRRGKILHISSGKCLTSQGSFTEKGSLVLLKPCSDNDVQVWSETENHEFRLHDLLCLDMMEADSSALPRIMKCHGTGGSQDWRVNEKGNHWLYHPVTGQCMTHDLKDLEWLKMGICGETQQQQWRFLEQV